MLPWHRASTPNLPEVTTVQECERLLGADLTIVFKHSPTCPVSLFAYREVMRFRTAQPETRVYVVSVRRQREIARHIAERTGVRHESPQVLVLRHGNVVGAASHDEITAELLAHLTAND
ncbi:MAG: bacillithiol system redox-active protein YtxJ [Acidobacteriaceae bacterium]|nr:bacillithiol system redox-active protein YtxJ [Acidobacteriaceae bacterium]